MYFLAIVCAKPFVLVGDERCFAEHLVTPHALTACAARPNKGDHHMFASSTSDPTASTTPAASCPYTAGRYPPHAPSA